MPTTEAFRALAEHSPDIIIRYDRLCRLSYVNPAFARISGLPETALPGGHRANGSPADVTNSYEEAVFAVIADGQRRELEHTWATHDGRTLISQFRLEPEFDGNGDVVGVVAIGRDITLHHETERQLRQTEHLARIGSWQWDYREGVSRISPEICRIFQQTPDWQPTRYDILNMLVEEDRGEVFKLFHEAVVRRDPELVFSFRLRHMDEILHMHSHVHIEYGANGEHQRLIGTLQDISERKNYESRLQQIALHDSLTGLPNRALLNDFLHQSLSKASRCGHSVGLLIVNLDRFKEINDTHGLSTGDGLLYESARRLSSMVGDYDKVARLGSDEFAIMLPEIDEAADLGSISHKILNAMARPFNINNQELFISACIGIAAFPADGNSSEALLLNADSALCDAKTRGRSSSRFYSSELMHQSKERAALEAALRHAEPGGQLELHYQPKIDLADGRLVGAEALVRWNHPDLGMVPPDKFIRIAENSGQIVGIATWVLTKACLAAHQWNTSGKRDLKIAVNLSSCQFRDDDLLSTVRSILTATACEARWLELEITESLLLDDDNEVRSTLQTFREMGISIAIDDFGTGYSALGYLKRFPIDVLKIDRSFTRDIMLERDSTELTKAIITMARSLNLQLVAEGIETEAQEAFLRSQGCHLGQGNRYGSAMTKEQFEAQLLQTEELTLSNPLNSS